MEMSIMFGYLIGKSVRANHISKAVLEIPDIELYCEFI